MCLQGAHHSSALSFGCWLTKLKPDSLRGKSAQFDIDPARWGPAGPRGSIRPVLELIAGNLGQKRRLSKIKQAVCRSTTALTGKKLTRTLEPDQHLSSTSTENISTFRFALTSVNEYVNRRTSRIVFSQPSAIIVDISTCQYKQPVK